MPQKIVVILQLVIVFLLPTTVLAQDITPTPPPDVEEFAAGINALINTLDCLLPCVWGFEVGVSELNEVTASLGQNFDLEYGNYYDGITSVGKGGITDWDPLLGATENILSGFTLQFNEQDERFVRFGLGFDTPEDSYVDWSPYLPKGIVDTYGVPDQILLRAPSDIYDLRSPVIYVYRVSGINLYIAYETPVLEKKTHTALFCNYLSHGGSVQVSIEVPGLENAEELRPLSLRFMDIAYPVEDVTAYDLETFAELFSREGECIQTQIGYED